MFNEFQDEKTKVFLKEELEHQASGPQLNNPDICFLVSVDAGRRKFDRSFLSPVAPAG